MLRRLIYKVFEKLDKVTPKYLVDSIRGIHYVTDNKMQRQSSWRRFRTRAKGKELLLIGSDGGYNDFLDKYGKDYYIAGAFDHFKGRVGQFRSGYRIRDIRDLDQQYASKRCILITSTLYADQLADILERKGIHEYDSYINMEIRKAKYWLTKRMYHFRFRVRPQIKSFWKNYIQFEIASLARMLHLGPQRQRAKDLASIKNMYEGKRCFIIATGPSLTQDDVELLKDEITFGVNGIIRMYKKTSFRPTFYAICDPNVFAEYVSDGTDMAVGTFCQERAFVTDTIAAQDKRLQADPMVGVIPYSYLNHMVSARGLTFRYRKNICRGAYNACSVVNFCINIAHYMGFHEIYLIGTDCTSSTAKQYFDDYLQDQKTNPYMKAMCERNSIKAYAFIKKKVEKDGVVVYNATRGGALEVFKRVSLERVLRLPEEIDDSMQSI